MHDDERRFYIKEIVRLRGLLDRVRESRRQVFAIGGYRPVRSNETIQPKREPREVLNASTPTAGRYGIEGDNLAGRTVH